MSGYKTPEQLDKEADEMMASLQPPEDTEPVAEEPEVPVTEPPSEPAEAEAEPEEATPVEALTSEQYAERLANAEASADKRIKDFQAKMTKATQVAADLRRQNDELSARLKSNEPTPLPTPDPVDDSEITALQEEYPSLAPVFKRITKLQQENATLLARFSEVQGAVTRTAEEVQTDKREQLEAAHFAAIDESHPDAREIAQSDDFQGWILRQPPMYQRAIAEGTAIDVIDVLTRYKNDVGIHQVDEAETTAAPAEDAAPVETKLDKARRLSTPTPHKVRTPPTNARPAFTRAQLDAMPQKEFEKREAEIDEAIAAGRVT